MQQFIQQSHKKILEVKAKSKLLRPMLGAD